VEHEREQRALLQADRPPCPDHRAGAGGQERRGQGERLVVVGRGQVALAGDQVDEPARGRPLARRKIASTVRTSPSASSKCERPGASSAMA
jgi:hypothetical protein